MRLFVFKIKHLIFVFTAIFLIMVIILTSGRAVTTFFNGNRELPIYSVERPDNRIALTFDCAWNDEDIDSIIAVLKKYNCTATFFVTGKWAETYSDSLNKLSRNGFEIGIHSYNHDDYTKLSADEIKDDVKKCNDIILKITGKASSIARTPSGAYNDNAVHTIEEMGLACIQWSVDGIDYKSNVSPDEIYNRVLPKTGRGDIILLHNGTNYTAAVLPKIIEALQKNYTMVNITDLIYKTNFTVDNNGRQCPGEML